MASGVVDGAPLINHWHDQTTRRFTATPAMTVGKHDVRIEW